MIPLHCDSTPRPYYDSVSRAIHLPTAECRLLHASGIDFAVAYAVFNLTHEMGHAALGCVSSSGCEAAADCYAAGHVAAVALRLGRTRAGARLIVRIARTGDFGYRSIAPTCWFSPA